MPGAVPVPPVWVAVIVLLMMRAPLTPLAPTARALLLVASVLLMTMPIRVALLAITPVRLLPPPSPVSVAAGVVSVAVRPDGDCTGRASGKGRVCQYGLSAVGAGP